MCCCPAHTAGRPSLPEAMTVNLIILPHAGGASHAYRGLADSLPGDAVPYFHDYPGHGRRSSTPLAYTMDDLVEDALDQAEPAGVFEAGWAVFGHSMGALVAHALIQRRVKQGASLPALFFASGARSPSPMPNPDPIQDYERPGRISRLPEDLFWLKMAGYGAIPGEISQNSDVRGYFETLLRTDFLAIETYYPDTAPIDVPVEMFYGKNDRRVTSTLDKWQALTQSRTRLHPFEGGHFFILSHLSDVGKLMGRALAGANI